LASWLGRWPAAAGPGGAGGLATWLGRFAAAAAEPGGAGGRATALGRAGAAAGRGGAGGIGGGAAGFGAAIWKMVLHLGQRNCCPAMLAPMLNCVWQEGQRTARVTAGLLGVERRSEQVGS
jgi:hypothetical protein